MSYQFSLPPNGHLSVNRRVFCDFHAGRVRIQVRDLGNAITDLTEEEAQSLAQWLNAHFPRPAGLSADEPLPPGMKI
jgi:hypothetical protein